MIVPFFVSESSEIKCPGSHWHCTVLSELCNVLFPYGKIMLHIVGGWFWSDADGFALQMNPFSPSFLCRSECSFARWLGVVRHKVHELGEENLLVHMNDPSVTHKHYTQTKGTNQSWAETEDPAKRQRL